jgi:hypothetical protein
MNKTAKKSSFKGQVYVECFRMHRAEAKDLIAFLESSEAVEQTGRVARKASGLVELGILFSVYAKPILITYAGNKILDIIVDQVKEWFRKRRVRQGCYVQVYDPRRGVKRTVRKTKRKRK